MRKKRLVRAAASVAAIIFFAGAVMLGLQFGFMSRHPYERFTPDYEKVDLTPLYYKDELTEEEFALIYRQTGVTEAGVRDLMAAGRMNLLTTIQANYFSDYEITSDNFALFTCLEETERVIATVPLKNGDILISDSTHFSGFKIGHSALVVDGPSHIIFESSGYGDSGRSATENSSSFTNRPSFIVLRPVGIPEETLNQICDYAVKELSGLKYAFTVGVLSPKFPKTLKRTHCAHIIWYAYKKFGYDIDATGGLVVTPKDIANSPLLTPVQVFGFDPEKLWS